MISTFRLVAPSPYAYVLSTGLSSLCQSSFTSRLFGLLCVTALGVVDCYRTRVSGGDVLGRVVGGFVAAVEVVQGYHVALRNVVMRVASACVARLAWLCGVAAVPLFPGIIGVRLSCKACTTG